MADRKLVVAIVGDDRSLQQAFTRSTASADKFGRNMKTKLGGGVSVAGTFTGLLEDTKALQKEADGLSTRLDGIGKAGQSAAPGLLALGLRAGAVGFALNAAFQASQHLQESLKVTGKEALTTSGKLRNAAAALAQVDIVGALQAFRAKPNTLEELGISTVEAANRMKALQAVADGTAKKLQDQALSAEHTDSAWKSYSAIVDEAGTSNQRLARELVNQVAAMQAADNAQNALADSVARLGTVFRTASGEAVTFKGAVDDLGGLRGPGLVDQINAALEVAGRGKQGAPPPKPIGPTAKNAAAQTVAQAQGDLTELLRLQKEEQSRLQAATGASTGNVKQREALNQQLATATASVISTQKAIAAQSKAAAAAAATAKASKLREHWNTVIGALTNAVSASELTSGLRDDISALQGLAAGIRKQIKAGVDVTAAQSQLISVTGQIAAKQKAIVENRQKAQKAAEQARQFRTIGLDASGNKPPPAIANLKKQVSQLFSRDDLTTNDKGVLARIRKVLIDPINKAKPETRAAAKEMIDGIRAELNKGVKDLDKGPHTKTTSFNTNKFLDGLGLGRDMEKELRARLSSFNSAGVALAGTRRPTGSFVGGQQPVVVESHTTVQLDGDVVGRTVTRSQQKTKRRNTTQKRGPNSGV